MSLEDDGASLVTEVQAFVTEATSQVATEDPTWAAVQAVLTNAGWTPPATPTQIPVTDSPEPTSADIESA